MRDSGDIMDDTLSEDTMMDCGGDDTLYDLIDLSTDISHSAPTIKDAAERLLALLGVDNNFDDDDDEDVFSSSEDEGVELDDCSDTEDSDSEENASNTRLLHSLASSLAEELKYSQKQVSPMTTTMTSYRHCSTRIGKNLHEITRDDQTMEITQETSNQDKKMSRHVDAQKTLTDRGFFGVTNTQLNESISSTKFRSETCFRTIPQEQEEKSISTAIESSNFNSWAAGWDACAAEALRYLVEIEKLSPHHPTVLAMKKHLDIQRERALAQFSI